MTPARRPIAAAACVALCSGLVSLGLTDSLAHANPATTPGLPLRSPTGQPAGPCAATVLLEGEPELAAAIGQALQARGLRTTAVEGCPATRVVLQRRDAYVQVELRDEVKSSRRQVADRETTVSVIESWVRSDLSAPLLLGGFGPAPATAKEEPDASTAAARVASAPWRGSVSLHAQLAGDVGGSAWMGASLRGCVRVHPLCVGGAWQTLGQLASDSWDSRRIATELFATAALPVRLGPLWLWPSIGLGVSWLHIAARLPPRDGLRSGDSGASDASSTPSLDAPPIAASADQGRLQGELRVELAIPLRAGWSLCLGVALDATLTGRSAPLLMGPPTREGEPSTDVAQLSLPPWGLFIGQLGLQWSPK